MPERAVPAVRKYGVLARLGHFARGVVYLAMGVWTARAAVVSHARALGPGDALKAVLGGRESRGFIAAVAAGFFADALFRLIQTFSGRSRRPLARAAFLIRGIGSALLGATALQIYLNVRLEREGDSLREKVGWVMAHPWGTKAIIAAGAIAAIVGAREIFEGATGRLRETFVKKRMGKIQKRWSLRVARLGLAAHGTLITLMGFFLVRAGLAANPRAAVLTGGALRRVGLLPLGSALLAGLAVGLIAYGLSQLLYGVYRRS